MGKPAKFPLKLESVIFTKLSFDTVFEHDPDSTQDNPFLPDNGVGVQILPDRKNAVVTQVTTKVNAEKSNKEPYVIEVICMALFTHDEGMPEEEVVKAATITGHNVCYGAIREVISWTTGRLPYGPINLGLSVLSPPSKQDDNEKEEK